MTLRARKMQRTHDALARAAVELSAEHGFDEVTVSDIADRAVVSRRTFHRYFDTKEAAFFADHQARLDRFVEALGAPEAGERPYDCVRRCLLALADEYDAQRAEMTRRHRTIQASRALLAHELQLDRAFEDAISDALCEPGADDNARLRSQMLGAAVFGVVRAVLRRWFEDPGAPPLRTLGAFALDVLEAGFPRARGASSRASVPVPTS